MAVVTSQLPELRRDSEAALETGYVSYINADLDRLITDNTLNGTLYMTALKYQPEWVLNWWHWLRASGVRTALVFACDESLLRFASSTTFRCLARGRCSSRTLCATALTAAPASSCAR
jgi:hypothetical protein